MQFPHKKFPLQHTRSEEFVVEKLVEARPSIGVWVKEPADEVARRFADERRDDVLVAGDAGVGLLQGVCLKGRLTH